MSSSLSLFLKAKCDRKHILRKEKKTATHFSVLGFDSGFSKHNLVMITGRLFLHSYNHGFRFSVHCLRHSVSVMDGVNFKQDIYYDSMIIRS